MCIHRVWDDQSERDTMPALGRVRKPLLLLQENEPKPYSCENAMSQSPFILLCEHASNRIPQALGDLGVSESERQRHIAWDIGALGVAQHLKHTLDACLFHHHYSRLVIDCNRPLGVPGLIPEVSEYTQVPGNCGLSDHDRQQRIDSLWQPYQSAIRQYISARKKSQQGPLVMVSVHSFTPVFKGQQRLWEVGLLCRDTRLSHPLSLALTAQNPSLVLGLNQPYRITDQTDYTVPTHGEQQGIAHVLVEIRHDLIDSPDGQALWAERLHNALSAIDLDTLG